MAFLRLSVVSDLIRFGVQLLIIIFGPMVTARFLAQLKAFVEEIQDPVLRAEIDKSYNSIRASREDFMRDRDDHQLD